MKYYIIAGEASGDLHASNLMKRLMHHDPLAEFRCWGGDLMHKEGGVLVKHYRDLAYMGFMEVISHLPAILSNLRFCKEDLLQYQPDVLILVDYPGFNLRLAKFASSKGLRVFYYISPQLWAWKSSRVHTIKKYVDRMYVILPFEKEFYARYDYSVEYHGHPLLDVIDADHPRMSRKDFLNMHDLPDKPIIALLPGSRKMEIIRMLRIMTSVSHSFPDFQFVVAGAPSIEESFYRSLPGQEKTAMVMNRTYDLLAHAHAALVTSGTATLETALMGVPEIVCYKGNLLSYLIARQIIHVKYISLVNLITGYMLVPELIQMALTPENLTRHLTSITIDGPARNAMLAGYRNLTEILGGDGASDRIAVAMLQYLTSK